MKRNAADPALLSAIREFLLEYLPTVRRRDDDTITSYRYSINLFLAFLDEVYGIQLKTVRASDFTQKNILLFIQWLQLTRNNSAPTINHRLSDLKNFCKFFMKKDVLSAVELQLIQEIEPVPDTRSPNFVWLTTEQVKLVLDSVSNTRNSVRDRFFLSLLYESGGRIDEILSLRVRDIVPASGGRANVHFFGKGKKHRITPLSNLLWQQAKEYFNKYHQEKNDDSFLFYVLRDGKMNKMSADNVQRILNYCEKRAKEQDPSLPHLHPHLFRRTRAMHLYEEGISLPMISEWLGHAQLETTKIYAKLSGEMKQKVLDTMQKRNNKIFQNESNKDYIEDNDMLRRICGLA